MNNLSPQINLSLTLLNICKLVSASLLSLFEGSISLFYVTAYIYEPST